MAEWAIWRRLAPYLIQFLGEVEVVAEGDAAMHSWLRLVLVEVCKVVYIMLMPLVECCLILVLRIPLYLGIIV